MRFLISQNTSLSARRSNRLNIFLLLGLFFQISIRAEIQNAGLFSLALDDSTRVIVITPAVYGTDPSKQWPVILMLHGWSGDETQWLRDAPVQELSDRYQLLLILPDGGYDGWWLDSPLEKGRNYETYLVKELLPWLVKNYQVSPKGTWHGILGLSMGGFGAMLQLFHNPDLFCAAVCLSGVIDLRRHAHSWGIPKRLGTPAEHLDLWRRNNLWDLMQDESLRVPPVAIITGQNDFALEETLEAAGWLGRHSADFLLHIPPGGHQHVFWKSHVEEAIAFIRSHMGD